MDVLELVEKGYKAWNEARSNTGDDQLSLAGKDLTGRKLIFFDFSNLDLSNAQLADAQLGRVELNNANLDGADLTDANLGVARLRGVNLRNACLKGVNLSGATLDGAEVSGADFTNASLQMCRFVDVDLSQIKNKLNLSEAILKDSSEVWPYLGGDYDHELTIDFMAKPARHHWPTVRLLIDGENVLGLERDIGFDPDEFFFPTEPLLPIATPRRVVLYKCHCGEVGCGALTAIISKHKDKVYWRDFFYTVGTAKAPICKDGVPTKGREMEIPNLRFDASQYNTEVLRASYDKSWLSRGRATSQILKGKLQDATHILEERNYKILWVTPCEGTDDSIAVHIRNRDASINERLIIELHNQNSTSASAEEIASRLASRFLSASEEEWKSLSIHG